MVMEHSNLVRDGKATELVKAFPLRLDSTEVGFDQFSAFIKPVAPRLLRVQRAVRTFISSQNADCVYAVGGFPLDPPVGLHKSVNRWNRLDHLHDQAQEASIGSF